MEKVKEAVKKRWEDWVYWVLGILGVIGFIILLAWILKNKKEAEQK